MIVDLTTRTAEGKTKGPQPMAAEKKKRLRRPPINFMAQVWQPGLIAFPSRKSAAKSCTPPHGRPYKLPLCMERLFNKKKAVEARLRRHHRHHASDRGDHHSHPPFVQEPGPRLFFFFLAEGPGQTHFFRCAPAEGRRAASGRAAKPTDRKARVDHSLVYRTGEDVSAAGVICEIMNGRRPMPGAVLQQLIEFARNNNLEKCSRSGPLIRYRMQN